MHNGVKLQTFQCSIKPQHICVCKYTGKIGISTGRDGTPIVDPNFGRIRVSYAYLLQKQRFHRIWKTGKHIHLRLKSDAVFDDMGQLIVADWYGKSVLVVNAEFNLHVKTIPIVEQIGNSTYMSLALTTKGELVVGKGTKPNELIFIKYLDSSS